MPEQPAEPAKRGTPRELADWLAEGGRTGAFARKFGVSPSTAYKWARNPKVKARVAELRRHSTDAAAGVLVKFAESAATVLVTLAVSETSSESTRLAAAKAVLSELRELATFADLRLEIDEIKARLAREEGRRATSGS